MTHHHHPDALRWASPAARQRSEHPRNYGSLPKWNGHAQHTGPCGDTMEFWLDVSRRRIAHIGFTTSGCESSRAAGSMATELAVGKSTDEAARIESCHVLAALGGLPKASEHCAQLAVDTLHAALTDFLDRADAARRDGGHRRETSPDGDEPHQGFVGTFVSRVVERILGIPDSRRLPVQS